MESDIEKIRTEIQKQNASWEAGDTEILRLPEDQKRRRLGMKIDEEILSKTLSRERPDIVKLMAKVKGLKPSDIFSEKSFKMIKDWIQTPGVGETVDWRNRNGQSYVTEIRDQHNCGSCVSFATIATLESMIQIERGVTADLSEAELFFCGGGTCEEGWYPDYGDGTGSIPYLINNGVSRENCFPYPNTLGGNDLPCDTCSDRDPTFVTNEVVISDIYQRKEYIRNIGPMIGGFDVYDDFNAYKGGIYSHVTGPYIAGHAVEVIGYEEEPTGLLRCWICKNSWGKNPNWWGDGTGFFRIKYNDCRITRFPFWGISGTLPELSANLRPYNEWKRVFKWDMVQQLINELRADE